MRPPSAREDSAWESDWLQRHSGFGSAWNAAVILIRRCRSVSKDIVSSDQRHATVISNGLIVINPATGDREHCKLNDQDIQIIELIPKIPFVTKRGRHSRM